MRKERFYKVTSDEENEKMSICSEEQSFEEKEDYNENIIDRHFRPFGKFTEKRRFCFNSACFLCGKSFERLVNKEVQVSFFLRKCPRNLNTFPCRIFQI